MCNPPGTTNTKNFIQSSATIISLSKHYNRFTNGPLPSRDRLLIYFLTKSYFISDSILKGFLHILRFSELFWWWMVSNFFRFLFWWWLLSNFFVSLNLNNFRYILVYMYTNGNNSTKKILYAFLRIRF